MRYPNHHVAAVYALAFNCLNTLLCSGDYYGTINLWDLSSGVLSSELQKGRNHDYAVGSLAFSPDGHMLAASSMDIQSKLTLWDVDRRELLLNVDSEESALAWSPDGRLLACGSNQVTLRNGTTGEVLQTLGSHNDWVTCLAFSRDGSKLATGTASEDGNLRVWDVRSGNLIALLSKPGWQAERMTFISENRLRFSFGFGTLNEWEISSSQDEVLFEPPKGSLGFPTAISSDGNFLAYESQEGDRYRTSYRTESGNLEPVRGDGYKSSIHVIEVRSQRELVRFSEHIDDISCMTFSASGSLLASADQAGNVFVWNIS